MVRSEAKSYISDREQLFIQATNECGLLIIFQVRQCGYSALDVDLNLRYIKAIFSFA